MGNEVSLLSSSDLSPQEQIKVKQQLIYDFAAIYHTKPAFCDEIVNEVLSKHSSLSSSKISSTIQAELNNSSQVLAPSSRDNRIQVNTSVILQEINKVRTNPKEYANFILNHRYNCFLNDFTYKIPTEFDDSGINIRTHEGKQLVKELIDILNTSSPLPPLKRSEYLEYAALDHSNDILLNGVTNNIGSDKSTLKDRIERYCIWRGNIAENIDLGSCHPCLIVMNLLIDDGVSSRGHRKSILSPGKMLSLLSSLTLSSIHV